MTKAWMMCLVWLLLPMLVSMKALAEPWVLVDTKSMTLKVMEGDKLLDTFEDIAIGRNGAGIKLERGDNTTPLGVFRVGWISEKSRFGIFIGLDYPNRDYAELAYREKRIDIIDYYFIRRALEKGYTPPQDTPLGGFIGIHGIGEGDSQVHANFNWTNGCVAVDNQQIHRLAQWVQLGTRVEIR